VLKERVFPEEVEKSKNNTHYKTRQGEFNRSIEIQTNQFNKPGRKSFRKTINKQNYAPHLQ
jgi:hypothetical protein